MSSGFVIISTSLELSRESCECVRRHPSEIRQPRNGRTTYISTEQDGTFHKCPRGKVGTFLLDRQVAVAYFHHVHVVMRIEVNRGQIENVLLHDRFYVLPSWAGIGTWSPQSRPESCLTTIPRTSNLLACARNDPMSAQLSMPHEQQADGPRTTRAPQVQTSASPQMQRLNSIGGSFLAMAALTRTTQVSWYAR